MFLVALSADFSVFIPMKTCNPMDFLTISTQHETALRTIIVTAQKDSKLRIMLKRVSVNECQ
jgi:hypothetical protein